MIKKLKEKLFISIQHVESLKDEVIISAKVAEYICSNFKLNERL